VFVTQTNKEGGGCSRAATLFIENASPLICTDESKGKQFITGGALWLPAVSTDAAVAAIASIKAKRGIAPETRIHCRVMFYGDARAKSAFSHLNPDDLHEILAECVDAMRGLGGSWYGAWIDSARYPRQLQLVGGKPFQVEDKHLAGLACFAAVVGAEHDHGTAYRLAFDPDPTKVDWGVARRCQATHFARTHSNRIELPEEHKQLLEMADVAAYSLAQSLISINEPTNWKAARFARLMKLMQMRTGEFAYTPGFIPPNTTAS
jgi:hypothetical protein